MNRPKPKTKRGNLPQSAARAKPKAKKQRNNDLFTVLCGAAAVGIGGVSMAIESARKSERHRIRDVVAARLSKNPQLIREILDEIDRIDSR